MAGPQSQPTRLVGDIGGTNARFGLVAPDDTVLHTSILAAADFADIETAIRAYLEERGDLPMPEEGALAIAAPIAGDEVRMTNHPWHFSISALGRRLGFRRLKVINDFTAQALALPRLGNADKVKIGGGEAVAGRPLGVLGPGSGLGVSGLIPAGDAGAPRWVPLTGEGGHATMAPANERESAVLERMRRHFDHVSAERCLSGPGLVNLYNSLSEVDGVPAAAYTPAQIADPEIGVTEPLCHEATAMFCGMLGTVAGNLAVTLGAQGGVYIAGGIVPRLIDRFAASEFRARFEDKGRMRPYLAAIPTYVVTHKLPAFLGCAAALDAD